MNIATVRAAIKTALAGLQIRVYDYVPLMPEPPCAVIYPENIPSQETLGGLRRPTFVVQLFVSMGNQEAGTRAMDKLVSRGITGSVFDALETISGYSISDAQLRSGSYRPVLGPDGTTAMLTAEIEFDLF
jgi:hypothetical protein